MLPPEASKFDPALAGSRCARVERRSCGNFVARLALIERNKRARELLLQGRAPFSETGDGRRPAALGSVGLRK